MKTKHQRPTNYEMLKTAMKGNTAFTWRHFIEVQCIRINLAYVRWSINVFDHGVRDYRTPNLRAYHRRLLTKVGSMRG